MSLSVPASAVSRAGLRTVAGARFLGLGRSLPDTVVTNVDLETRLATSDAWIRERTGIVERRIAAPGETTADLAVVAGAEALDGSEVAPSDVDVVIVATTTPDTACPATAASVQARLGTAGAAFDLNAACAGFAYALYVGIGMLAAGSVGHVLVIGADRFSALVDPDDRSTAILFGDGAGAVLLGASGPGAGDARADDGLGPGLLSADLGGDGAALTALHVPPGERYVSMDGQEVYRRATRAMVASCSSALDAAGARSPDVDLFVPHQANARIIDATARRLGVPAERVVVDVDRYGNTSAASVPIALADAADDGRLTEGTRVLLAGIGAGMAWASLYLRWGS